MEIVFKFKDKTRIISVKDVYMHIYIIRIVIVVTYIVCNDIENVLQ